MTAEILEKIGSYTKFFDKAKILKAFDFVSEKYAYLDNDKSSHLNVLEILLPLKPDEDTIVSILLHDLFVMSLISEDTVKENFGPQVLEILSSLKKIYGLKYSENDKGIQVEVLRKMFMTLAKDIRVILIWLAHRLCMMQTLIQKMSVTESYNFAKETMNVYVPIASRLGIYKIKIQLEDLAFKYLHPEEYERITEQVKEFAESKGMPMEVIKQQLVNFLKARGIEAEIHGRIKNYYSIFTKLSKKGYVNVNDLYDFFAIRVILPEKENYDHLYAVLGLIHSEWKPISSRFKDYVAVPKPNGYRSLHTVVLGMGPKGFDKPVEIQIRDEKMHREAEYGVASHWLYKTKRSSSVEDLNRHVDWIRGLEQIHEFFGSESSDVMREVEIDIFKDRIFVLTPRGEVKDLPVGAIPLDFAYAVHTDVGNHCVSAKVNNVMVPLDYQLKNGDVVEIILKNDATPKVKWLAMVKSSFAKNKIKAWFTGMNKDRGEKEVKEPLIKKALPNGVKVSKKLPPSSYGSFEQQVVVGGQTGFPAKIAACCKPVIGQKIVGYINSRGKRISIHRLDCPIVDTLNREKIIFAEWKGHEVIPSQTGIRIGLELEVFSRVGLIQDITMVMSKMKINILDIMIKRGSDRLHHDYFLLDLHELGQLDALISELEEIEGVVKVRRADEVFRNAGL